MADITIDMIEERERELQPLYDRMDGDADRLRQKPYTLPRLEDPTKSYQNVVNITMNTAANYVDGLSRLISNAVMQIFVEGMKNDRSLNDKETGRIEEFLSWHYEKIDEILLNRGFPKLMIWLARHINARGWIVARYQAWLNSEREEQYVTELQAWDMRYVAWENDRDSLEWGSQRTFRTKREIQSEYPKANVTGDKKIEVVTFLDRQKEKVWIRQDQVKERTHGLGYVPLIIQPCPEGFHLLDPGYIEHVGESALFLNRQLFDEWNRIISLEVTAAAESVMPGYTSESQDRVGEGMPYPEAGSVMKVGTGESPKLVEKRDFNIAAQLARKDILEGLEYGGRNIDIGNINQPFSAVALGAIEEIRKRALFPRFEAIDMFRRRLSWMMIDQYKRLYDIGGIYVKNHLMAKGELEGNYIVRTRFISKTKEMEILNIAVASAAKAIGLPDEVWVRDILLAENPDEILEAMRAEKAAMADPVIGLIRLGLSLIDEADSLKDEMKDAKLLEAMRIRDRIVAIIEGTSQTEERKTTEVPRGSLNVLPPLLAAAGRGAPTRGNGREEEIT